MLTGVGALIFTCVLDANDDREWTAHRMRLRQLCAAVPPDAGVPVLVLLCSDVWPRGSVSDEQIRACLKLDDPFYSDGRVGSVLFHMIKQSSQLFARSLTQHDEVGRCVQWLAGQTPAQPLLREYSLGELYSDSIARVQSSLQIKYAGRRIDGRELWPTVCRLNAAVRELIVKLRVAADKTRTRFVLHLKHCFSCTLADLVACCCCRRRRPRRRRCSMAGRPTVSAGRPRTLACSGVVGVVTRPLLLQMGGHCTARVI